MALTLTKISPAVQAAPKPKLSMTALYNGLIDCCVLTLFAFEEKLYVRLAVCDDPTWKSLAYKKYAERVGELTAGGSLDSEAALDRLKWFLKTSLTRVAHNQIKADPGIFLNNLAAGKFDQLDEDTRSSLRRSANDRRKI
jgi:hypothetical protein